MLSTAVIYVGRKRIGFYMLDHFALSINGQPLTSSEHRTGSYPENCRAQGEDLADLMADRGVKQYRVRNGHAIAENNGIHAADRMPEDGIRELEEAFTRKKLKCLTE